MRKEVMKEGGNHIATNFHPQVPFWAIPKITSTYTSGGIRYYRDDAGRSHVADTFDQVWGKRSSTAILPAGKKQFQRTFR